MTGSEPVGWIAVSFWSVVLAALVAIFTAIMVNMLRDRSKSRYDFERQMAILSDMRESYERRLSDLTKHLMVSEERWRDVNHLLIESQRAQRDQVSIEAPKLTQFLQNLGVTPSDLEIDKKLIVVLTPFSNEEEPIYDVIKDTCSRNGFKCVRGDEEYVSSDILSHVTKLIVRARLVVANITSRNPNVFYELGIAHTLDKSTILVSKLVQDVPFDVRAKRILLYKDEDDLRYRLTEMMLQAVSEQSDAATSRRN